MLHADNKNYEMNKEGNIVSYQVESISGYGVKLEEVEYDAELLRKFIKNHNFLKWMESNKIDVDNIDDDELIKECEGYDPIYCCGYGIPAMLAEAIYNEVGIELFNGHDNDDNYYIMFLPQYPWATHNPTIKSKEDVSDVLLKYIAEVTTDRYDCDYWTMQEEW